MLRLPRTLRARKSQTPKAKRQKFLRKTPEVERGVPDALR